MTEPIKTGDKFTMQRGWVKRRWFQFWRPRYSWSDEIVTYHVTKTYTSPVRQGADL